MSGGPEIAASGFLLADGKTVRRASTCPGHLAVVRNGHLARRDCGGPPGRNKQEQWASMTLGARGQRSGGADVGEPSESSRAPEAVPSISSMRPWAACTPSGPHERWRQGDTPASAQTTGVRQQRWVLLWPMRRRRSVAGCCRGDVAPPSGRPACADWLCGRELLSFPTTNNPGCCSPIARPFNGRISPRGCRCLRLPAGSQREAGDSSNSRAGRSRTFAHGHGGPDAGWQGAG